MLVPLWVPVVALPALSVMMAVNKIDSPSDIPLLSASKVAALKLTVLLVPCSPLEIVCALPRSSYPPLATLARISKVPSTKVLSLGKGTVTLIPVLVLFHFPAVTVPPVVMTEPTVKSAGTVVSKKIPVTLTSVAAFPAASTPLKSI